MHGGGNDMILDNPAVCFRKGEPLARGMPRTLIVLGAARGGTTMIAQILNDLGIFMGEGLASTCQDSAMNDISRALFTGDIDVDDPAIEQLLRRRDRQFAVWGWKFPTQVFDKLYAKARNPHVIVVFRDPVAIATRESVAHGYRIEPCFQRALEQIASLGSFMFSTPYPCLGVSYERGLARTVELVDALADFAGIAASQGLQRQAAQRAKPGSSSYVMETRANNIEGTLDRVDHRIAGWLRYPHQVNRRVAFTILIDDIPIYQGVADGFRPDLETAFNNDGRCSFDILIPEPLRDGNNHKVSIKIPGESAYSIVNNDMIWTIS